MFAGTQKRLRILRDKKSALPTKGFALLEISCFYFSVAVLFFLMARIAGERFGGFAPLSGFGLGLLRVCLAAAVGFLTNWIAVEMIFKPYKPVKWFPLWPQGLVPRNKEKIAEKAGEKIMTDLLNPKLISEKIAKTVADFIQSEKTKQEMISRFLLFIERYQESILKSAVPLAESELIRLVGENVTHEKIRKFWDNVVRPRLQTEEFRSMIAEEILRGLKSLSPDAVETSKQLTQGAVKRAIHRVLPEGISNTAADSVVRMIDWSWVEKEFVQLLDSPETEVKLQNALGEYSERFQEWLDTDEGKEKTALFIAEFRVPIESQIRVYIKKELPARIGEILTSEKTAFWFNDSFVPLLRNGLEPLVKAKTPEILEQVNFKEIVVESINKMDVREFHNLINDVAAESLGAIQVLGFFLGGAVGLLQALL